MSRPALASVVEIPQSFGVVNHDLQVKNVAAAGDGSTCRNGGPRQTLHARAARGAGLNVRERLGEGQGRAGLRIAIKVKSGPSQDAAVSHKHHAGVGQGVARSISLAGAGRPRTARPSSPGSGDMSWPT